MTLKINLLIIILINITNYITNLVKKTDFDNKLKTLNQKLNSNKTKHLLIKNGLETFDSIYFRGKTHFEEDGTQNYLVFQPIYRYFKTVTGVGSGNNIFVNIYVKSVNNLSYLEHNHTKKQETVLYGIY